MKKINGIILILILMIIGTSAVNAEYSIKVEAETGNAGSNLEMTLEGINYEEAYTNYEYYVRFVNEGDEKPELTGNPYDSEEGIANGINSYFRVGIYVDEETNEYHNSIAIDDDWYILDGYTKAYIVECKTYQTCEILEKPIIVEKPELPKLTQRYQNYLFTQDDWNSLSIFPFFPFSGKNGSHEINTKIGLIKDEKLIKKLAKNDSGSYEELLKYAKENDGTIFSKLDSSLEKIDIGDFEVINGSYYYMYTYYTNTDGMYRNLDDITVVMGEADMLVNDVKWNIEETDWEKFISDFKNHENVKLYDNSQIEFYNDENKFIITLNLENSTFKTQFNYTNGIISYVFDDSKTEEDKFIDSYFNEVALSVFANKFGYDIEKLIKFLQENSNLTIEEDGIEYATGKLYVAETNENKTVTVSGDYFKTLKFDILNGSKTYENKLVQNPKTGVTIKYGVLILFTLLTGTTYLLIRKYSKFPKHN